MGRFLLRADPGPRPSTAAVSGGRSPGGPSRRGPWCLPPRASS